MKTNSSRLYLDAFVAQAAASVPSGALVLDAGAGDSLYRHHFHAHRYESADFLQVKKDYAPDIDYVGDLSDLPVADGRFDLVLLTQVLEHLPTPIAVLEEMHRVLKPGGVIWASTPLFYEEHETPYDFYRYTQFGLQHAFTAAGFENITVEWLEGYLGTVAYELDVAARALPRPTRPAIRAVSRTFSRMDLRRKITDRGHPKNYTIVATRPAS